VTELPSATPGRNIWIRAGALLDGTCSEPLKDVHVVYNGAAFVFVGTGGRTPPRDLLRAGQDSPDFAAPDCTMLPGLIEAHAHLFLEGGELNPEKRSAYIEQSPAELLSGALERLPKLVRLGIAGVRDAGDKDGVGLALSRLYAGADRPLMPYVESPGAAIYHRGRYGSFMGDPIENYASPRDCVEARVKSGSDRIKLIPTGIINFKKAQVTSEPQMTTEEIAQLVAAAKSFGRQTFAHSSGDTGIDRVIDGGVDSVEHGFFVRDDQLARMRDRRTAWVPTFAPVREQIDHADVMGWDPEVVANLKGILDRHAASLVKAHQMGVLIVAGSDAGSVGVAHGLGLLREMELMEGAGLPAIAVVNAATGVGSDRFAYREKLGRVEAGYLCRFILTRHSPAETVSNLRRPRWVVFDGNAFEEGEVGEEKGL
jgi:imidazolonepropionase-like amidohydrolase